MVWAAALGAGASLLGGMMGNSSSAQQAANSFSYQKHMMRNEASYRAEGFRRAGLNPILAANPGAGSGIGPGPMAPQTDPITPAVHSGLAAYRGRQEVENMKEQEKNIGAERENIHMDTGQKQTNIHLGKEQILTQHAVRNDLNSAANLKNVEAEKANAVRSLTNQQEFTERERAAQARAQTAEAEARARYYSHSARSAGVEADIDTSDFGWVTKHIDRGANSAGAAAGALKEFIPMPRVSPGRGAPYRR